MRVRESESVCVDSCDFDLKLQESSTPSPLSPTEKKRPKRFLLSLPLSLSLSYTHTYMHPFSFLIRYLPSEAVDPQSIPQEEPTKIRAFKRLHDETRLT